MKSLNFTLLVFVVTFICTSKVFAEYNKYLITKETVVLSDNYVKTSWQTIDTICIVHEGDIVTGQIYTYNGIENPNYIEIAPEGASGWGCIPSDCARFITKEEAERYKRSRVVNIMTDLYNRNPISFWILIGLGLVIFIFFIRFFVRLSTRCKICGKWGSVKMINHYENLIDSTQTTIRKSEKHTDIYGKEHTNYYHVPATRETYDHLKEYKCKYCGNKTEKNYTTSDTHEN